MLQLPSELTQNQATACLRTLLPEVKSSAGNAIEVDASALTRFDSSALAVLLECRRESLSLGKTFAVHGLPPQLGNLAAIYGIGKLLGTS
jgi:phospholipid transport system transporter-binding protein